MNLILLFTMNKILKGIGSILLGIFSIWYGYKYPEENDSPMFFTLRNYILGAVCLIIGVIYLINQITIP